MTNAERIVSILLEDSPRIRGEYWIVDSSGEVWFADGSVGDVDHVGYVIDHCRRAILDLFGGDSDFEHLDDKEFGERLTEAMVDEGMEADPAHVYQSAANNIKAHFAADQAKLLSMLDSAYGQGDPRVTAIRYLGWKWVRQNNVTTYTFGPDDRQAIIRGYDAIAEEDGDPDADWNELEIQVMIESTGNRFYTTLEALRSGYTPGIDPTWGDRHPRQESDEQQEFPLNDPVEHPPETQNMLNDLTQYVLPKQLKPGDEACSATSISKDIIEACLEMLKGLHPSGYEKFVEANSDELALLNNPENHTDDIQIHELMDNVFNAIHDYCPPYTYFGFNEADGSVGCWENRDQINEDIQEGLLTAYYSHTPQHLEFVQGRLTPKTEYTWIWDENKYNGTLYRSQGAEVLWHY